MLLYFDRSGRKCWCCSCEDRRAADQQQSAESEQPDGECVCVCERERERERERTNKQTNNRWRTSCGGAALQRRWEKDLLNYSKYVFFFSTSIFSSQSPTNTSDMCTTVARKHLQLQINSQSTINRQSIDNQSINMFNERKYLNFGSSVISVGFFIRSSDFDFFAFSLEDFTSRVLRRL